MLRLITSLGWSARTVNSALKGAASCAKIREVWGSVTREIISKAHCTPTTSHTSQTITSPTVFTYSSNGGFASKSAAQVLRDMRSISNGLGQWVKKGLLEIHAAPPALQGPKHHLVMMHNKVWALRPS